MKEQDGKNLGFDSCLMYDVENWTQVYEVSFISGFSKLFFYIFVIFIIIKTDLWRSFKNCVKTYIN